MKRKLLVVEDDPAVCRALRKLLVGQGYDVLSTHRVVEALELVRKSPVNLVVLDMSLGIDDGQAVLVAMAEANPRVPAVIIAAECGQHDRAFALGAEALIEKPIDVPSFLKTIEALLAQRTDFRRRPDWPNCCRSRHPGYAMFLRDLAQRRSAPLKLSATLRAALSRNRDLEDDDEPAQEPGVAGSS